ncbi:3-hydroxyacyl-CoA dehydrogenase family protein [Microbacterium sp. HD4P20]|uniref:3-hydroxyacyl-CoA dehydrogenase family protein n=1 Tax=Microbacterium sp. HD4P20 TaxID=2864874 RepID=UPI001C63DAC5|nr:3-hydroxyacyl-CoA dehydrogenase family protein [Microbacterium sp. HD4P20]MCP2635469.1 3-hydroxyacyl-CoA dehydrogenase family protein [Microbacterium sp. HD4P20]
MTRIAVVGSGYMGGGMAQVFALGGHDVVISDVTAEIAASNLERIRTETEQFEQQGLFAAGATAVIAERITAAQSIEDAVVDAEFIEEAVPERIEIKHETLRRISRANPAAVIGSNTSTISIAKLAEAVEHPERFLGVHFSNPAPFVPGVELIPHPTTAESAIVAAEALIVGSGKIGARVKDATGFVLNRLQYALFHEATQLVDEGVATPEDIDAIVRSTFGFRLPFFGPFAIADMAGLDVYAFCYASLQSDFPERFATPAILAERIERGELGTKTGAGFRAIEPERIPELVAYRNRAYAKMKELLDELGPSPFDEPAGKVR